MKNYGLRTLGALLALAVVVSGCNGIANMVKNSTSINYSVTPSPLEMHADSVEVTINGKYPDKYFVKGATLKVTPYLAFAGKEVEFKPVGFKGESADGDGKVIAYAGGSYSYTGKIKYQDGMEDSKLMVKATVTAKGADKEFDAMEIAKGVVVTPLLAKDEEKAIMAEGSYQQNKPASLTADIHYTISKSNVRASELSEADIKAVKELIVSGADGSVTFKGVSISSYASPDGEQNMNSKLAENRGKGAQSFMAKEFKSANVADAKGSDFFKNDVIGEDWEGFKTEMEKSTIEDKALILRVLTMYPDLDKREEEIKNMAKTYVELADVILPKLRRAQFTINAEIKGRTPEEIKTLLATTPDQLSADELIYASGIEEDDNKKLEIYKTATKLYPADWRAANNTGYIYLMQNKLSEATAEFEKADKLSPKNAVVNNNLGVVSRLSGNNAKALDYYRAAAPGGQSETQQNMGFLQIKSGDYADAVSSYGSACTFNAALAKVLNDDAEGAMSTLDCSEDKESAIGFYLKAVIGAKMNDASAVIENLNSAIAQDPALKAKAAKDAAFHGVSGSAEFKAIVE
ncbi:MAG: hypothetical protein HRT72_08260 [Flavobacteriales bacterium]|nr:hypothetical protein [Flavobacteriales bacterium]